MKCEDALLLISGHIDGENTPEEEQRLQEHLEACEACRAVMAAYMQQDADLASVTVQAPADLCDKVMASISEPKKKNRWWPVLAAAAAVALVVGLNADHLPAFRQETAAPMAARTASVEFQETAAFLAEINGQIIAEVRGAYVVETLEVLPEMENCAVEELEDGSLLYCLPSVETALEMAETYKLNLFWHEPAEEAYALLIKEG